MLVHGMDGSEISFRPYLSTDGNLYAAVIYDEAVGNSRMIAWDAGCFFTFPEGTGLTTSPSTSSPTCLAMRDWCSPI